MSTVYVDSHSEFYNTYRMYRDYIGYKKPLSYNQWMRLDDNFKLAALYVQFYNEITLAWYKVKTAWAIEEEGVETINQYLAKNVEKIKEDRKRFKPAYIYRVAYNCLYCICIDPTKNKERYYNETPSTFSVGDDELDWFDVKGESVDVEEDAEAAALQNFFDSLSGELQVYIAFELGEINDIKAVRRLKKEGYIKGNTQDSEYREYVVKFLKKFGSTKLRAMCVAHPELFSSLV